MIAHFPGLVQVLQLKVEGYDSIKGPNINLPKENINIHAKLSPFYL